MYTITLIDTSVQILSYLLKSHKINFDPVRTILPHAGIQRLLQLVSFDKPISLLG
jgi:hypothetical protein